jgi:hypothetical protein
MYGVTCTFARERISLDGSTQECTPTFVRVLLPRSAPPTTSTALVIAASGKRFRLDGHVVASHPAGDLWSIGIDVSGTDATVAAQWSDLLTHLRASR